jgi:hypothetical protein
MAIIQEVRDAITAVAETVDHVRTISEAIKNGRDYLKTKHPHVSSDLVAMCEEMRKSSEALAAASSIVTHFRFVIGDALAHEASRFNEHLVNHKAQAETVEARLRSMRGHCSVIEKHAESIRKNAVPNRLTPISEALGLSSGKRERDLAAALQGIYDEETQYHLGVYAMANAIKAALKSVQDTLGPPGVIDPTKVPDASIVLGEYATAFARLEASCNYNALQLQTSIDSLQGRAL